MSVEVASAYVSIMPSLKGFGPALGKGLGPGLDRSGKESGRRFGKVFASASISPIRAIGAAAVGLFAADKVVGFFKDANAEAREAQKVGALTTQVIKSTGGAAKITASQVGDLAGAISAKTGIDDEAIQSASNLLLTFTGVRNEVGKGNDVFNRATQAATDMGAALGGDPKSSAIQLGKALNDPIKGITALTRVGVSFTAQQKKQVEAMVKSGDTLGAQKLILGELNKEFGGAAAASATNGEKLAVAFGNFKEQIGTALLPVIDKVAGFLTSRVIPAVASFVKGIQDGSGAGGAFRDFVGQIVGKAKALADLVQTRVVPVVAAFVQGFRDGTGAGGRFRDVLAKVVGATKATVEWIVRNRDVLIPLTAGVVAMVGAYKTFVAVAKVAAAVTKIAAGAQAALNIVMALNPIGLVIALVAGLVVGLIVAYKRSATFRAVVDGALRAVGKAGQWMWDTALKPALGFLKSTFTTVGDVISNVVKTVLVPVIRGFANAYLVSIGKVLDVAAVAAGALGMDGLAKKLRTASGKVAGFRKAVNAELDKITDTNVNVWIKASGLGQNTVVRGRGGGLSGSMRRARGGSVFGPGSETSDSIPALLSNNEHVWTAAEVRGAGGHGSIERLRQLAKAGALPAFARGGRVVDISVRQQGMRSAYGAVAAAINRANAERAQEGTGPSYGGGSGAHGGTRASLVAFGRMLVGRGFSVAEGPPPFGPVHRVHSKNSKHYQGRAIDVNHGAGTSASEQRAIDGIVGLARGYGLDAIWRAPGHFNHAHFSYDEGGMLGPNMVGVNRTGKPERVLTPAQTQSFDRLVSLLESGQGLGGGITGGTFYSYDPHDIVAEQRKRARDAAAVANLA